MRTFKLLALSALFALLPVIALASEIIIDDYSDDFVNAIPEPTSALMMIAGFATVAAVRRLRK